MAVSESGNYSYSKNNALYVNISAEQYIENKTEFTTHKAQQPLRYTSVSKKLFFEQPVAGTGKAYYGRMYV